MFLVRVQPNSSPLLLTAPHRLFVKCEIPVWILGIRSWLQLDPSHFFQTACKGLRKPS